MAKVWIGTSGWHYPHWRGHVYPEGQPAARALSYYSERFARWRLTTASTASPPMTPCATGPPRSRPDSSSPSKPAGSSPTPRSSRIRNPASTACSRSPKRSAGNSVRSCFNSPQMEAQRRTPGGVPGAPPAPPPLHLRIPRADVAPPRRLQTAQTLQRGLLYLRNRRLHLAIRTYCALGLHPTPRPRRQIPGLLHP